MKKCSVCHEKFPEDEGRIDEDGKFVCMDCDRMGVSGNDAECPECGESSEEFRTEGVCPHCGAEAESEDEEDEEEDEDEGEGRDEKEDAEKPDDDEGGARKKKGKA